MNTSIKSLQLTRLFSTSPIVIHRSNMNLSSSIFSFLASYIVLFDNRFNSCISRTIFSHLLTPVVKEADYYPSGTIYGSTGIPTQSVFEDCGFLNIIHSETNLVVYSNSGGMFRMERCTFYRVQTSAELSTTVKVEPINYAFTRYNCFQSVQAYIISFCMGRFDSNTNYISISDFNIHDSKGSHSCLSQGKLGHHLTYSNSTSNPTGSGLWFGSGLIAGSITKYHSVYNCSGLSAIGTNLNVETKFQYFNIINNHFSHGIIFIMSSSSMRILDWSIIKYRPILYVSPGQTGTLIAERVSVDSSFNSVSLPLGFSIISNIQTLPIRNIDMDYCMNQTLIDKCTQNTCLFMLPSKITCYFLGFSFLIIA